MKRWAMVVDLRRCIGCKSCIIACSRANQVPEGLWRKLDKLGEPQPPDRKRFFLTRNCMHCDTPPCKSVCPTGATYKRPDGIVDIDYEKCVGCGYCILAYPYDARVIYRYFHAFPTNAEFSKQSYGPEYPNREGICTKCNFCLDRIDNGLQKNLIPGIDPDATPLCVLTCSCGALSFGDLNDSESNVSLKIEKHQVTRLSEDLKTDPAVYYILK